MVKPRIVSARVAGLGLIGSFLCTNALAFIVQSAGWWPAKILLFVCLMFLPGAALLRILKIVPRLFSLSLLYSLGLSLLVLMLSGLMANQLLPLVGIERPLQFAGAFGMWNVVVASLIGAALLVNREPMFHQLHAGLSKTAGLLLGASALLPFGALLGAHQVNNGGGPFITLLTLGASALLITYTFVLRRRLSDGLLAWFIFILGLSILLMTSLRGWDIVGHDIEREFRVYTLTHLGNFWDISAYRDPYNACLSITILPEVLGNILNVSGILVFKVLLQVMFAACPVVIFVLLRRYVSRLGALVGSLLFICYPTFITDSAMLTRQGIAYLFFALALLIISNQTQTMRCKILFMLTAAGAILSHYSTAYMFVGLFAVAVACKLVVSYWLRRRQPASEHQRKTVISPLFAALLFMMTFVWYSQITATSSGVLTTLQASLVKIPTLFSDDNKSSDTSAALFFSGGKSLVELYESYLMAGKYQANSELSYVENYLPNLTSDDLPLTPLGEQARRLGIDPSITTALRQDFAKALQLLAIAGVVYATFSLFRRSHPIGIDFICLSLAGLVLLALMVILPVLSVNYGILRAFQQGLIFLLLPITMFLILLGRRLWPWLRTTVATVGGVMLFLLFTNFFAQLLGGVGPSLTMNNSGLYYGLYYSTAADRQSFAWLKKQLPKSADVRAANTNRALMHDPNYPFKRTGILPTQLAKESYVYLDAAQIERSRLYTYHESNPLILTFPREFYDTFKNNIYSTHATRVYK